MQPLFVGFRERGFWKRGLFRNANPETLEILGNLEILEILENLEILEILEDTPDGGKERSIRPFSRHSR